MVQSTNCIIILVPIPSLPKPPFPTMLISCKRSCCFSPLRNTGYLMRKLAIHFGNHPHKTLRETVSHAAQYYTAAIQNATFKANHIHRSVICSSHSQILPLPHFYIPDNVNPHNKTPALKNFHHNHQLDLQITQPISHSILLAALLSCACVIQDKYGNPILNNPSLFIS